MANVSLQRFNSFSQDLCRGKHNFQSGQTAFVYKAAFLTAVPAATATSFSGLSEVAASGGYAAGGLTLTVSDALTAVTQTVNTASVTTYANILFAANLAFTAGSGGLGAIAAVAIYNSTNGTLIGWYPYSNAAMNSGDQFNVTFDQTNGFEQIGAPTGS